MFERLADFWDIVVFGFVLLIYPVLFLSDILPGAFCSFAAPVKGFTGPPPEVGRNH